MIDTLRKAVSKQIELSSNSTKWEKQLFPHSPPILWFGNSNAEKRIVTIGANPSRWEVITKDNSIENRFRMLNGNESLNTVLTNETLANEIINGYNTYFTKNPYTQWFGNSDQPFKVECFLRGFNATLYNFKEVSYQCIHIDLFPFPTLDDYNKLSDIVMHDLFINGWAEVILYSILNFLNPEKILVFGRANSNALFTYALSRKTKLVWSKISNGMASYAQETIKVNGKKYPCLCISTNLGNPKPFTKKELYEFGFEMRSKV